MEKCLGCGNKFNEKDMVDTNAYLGEGIQGNPKYAGFYCDDCMEDNDNEICNYCGVPSEIYHYANSNEDNSMDYCEKCYIEVKEFI